MFNRLEGNISLLCHVTGVPVFPGFFVLTLPLPLPFGPDTQVTSDAQSEAMQEFTSLHQLLATVCSTLESPGSPGSRDGRWTKTFAREVVVVGPLQLRVT